MIGSATTESIHITSNALREGEVLFNYVGLPGGSVAKNLPANAGDAGLIPELVRSPGKGNGNPLLAWEIPWMEEPGELESIRTQTSRTQLSN